MSGEIAALEWGVKQSFRAYVESAGGVIETGGGVERSADGGFVFPASAGGDLKLDDDGKPAEGVAAFEGEVRFDAHGGMLKVYLADPKLEIGEAGAVITVADSPARDRRVELAQLDLAAATRDAAGEISIPAKLSRDGWRVLGDHYPMMTPLDPVRLRLR